MKVYKDLKFLFHFILFYINNDQNLLLKFDIQLLG